MAFFFLCVSVFIMFFQPVYIWPWLEQYQPLRNSAIIALIAYSLVGYKSKTPFFSVKTNKYFVLFALFQTISSFKLWSQAGIETFNLWLKLGIVYYLIFKSVMTEKRLQWIILMIAAAIGYLSYYSVNEYIVSYVSGTRAYGFGWYENGNDLSMILVSVIPLAVLLSSMRKNIILKYFFLGVAGTFAFNILFTASRNGLLGLCVVGLLSVLSLRRINKVIRIGLIVLLGIAVVTVGVVNILARPDLNSLTGDDSSENRKIQWKAGIRMTLANPILGVGRGEFRYRAVDYGGIRGLQPHNTIIQVFGDTGIPGGIFYVLFAIWPLIEGWKIIERGRKNKIENEQLIIYRFLLISLTGFWVCAFFSNRYHSYILYVLIALIVAAKQNLIHKADKI